METKNYFESMDIGGYYHNVAAIRYDSNNKVRFIIASFLSRQLLDNCLTLMQKGESISIGKKKLTSIRKGYTCKVVRVHDENNGDGVHGLIYSIDDNTIKVYQNENKVDKVFEYLKVNTQCGLMDEWKSYFFNELYSNGYIEECDGFDYTGKSPTVLWMKDIDTDLIRNIKALGLRNGNISLPVEEVKEIDTNMSFLEIIEKLIIPNIEADECQYNIGDPISDIFKAPIVDVETNERKALYPRQMIMAQGCLNAVRDLITEPIINLGMGTGKTMISTRLMYAAIKEHFKTDNARIGLMIPSHLLNKWIREIKSCLLPLGVNLTFHIIRRFTDVDKLSKKPNGLEILIFQKDITKRSYLHEYSGKRKHNTYDIYNFSASHKVSKEDIIFEECSNLKLSKMKFAAIMMERTYHKKVVLYKSQRDNEGKIKEYKVITTSETIKETFGNSNKSYDFIINDIQKVKDIVFILKDTIKKEKLIKSSNSFNIEDSMVCPSCGGAIYLKGKDMFDSDKVNNFERFAPDKMTSENLHCSHYIKADGTNLTNAEIRAIRWDDIQVIYTTKSSQNPYLDAEGNELKDEELLNAKKKGSGYSILVKKCNHKLWGAKDQKGYRDYDNAKYYYKRFGKGSLACSIVDEVHEYSRQSSQNYSFSYVCRSSKIILPLTGTLTGGKASDLFYILWNLCPQKMVQLGFKYNEIGRFIDMFGRRKRTTKIYHDEFNKSATGRTVMGSWVEIPGISPQIINQILSERMISRTIDDMGIPMPKLRYFKHVCEMDDELAYAYKKLEQDIVSFIRKNRHINVGSSYLNSLLSYPDMPQQEPIYALGGDMYVATPTWIDLEDKLFNKERKLIETIERELAEDRRVLVYSLYSGVKGVSKRLVGILSKKFKVAELTSSITKQKREEWIEKQYQKGVQVIITNPKCVDTGLDIIQYPTVYFYETTYAIKVMRQAERRAYRPNNPRECRIYYSYYKNTLQEDALKLQGSKKASSLAVEGIFSEDMLSQMGDIGESPASILNKILEGKIKMKESDLDAFGFEEEEVSYEFNDINNEEIEITRKTTTSENIIMPKNEVQQLSIFEIDEEFMKKRNIKKAKAKVSLGQLGFLFE
ncbi:helicase-related protein (plasmid) [Clostridium beijerinckii]|uniref:helicase-related protein n=1 Tax=Clostridium beijerinckii TaxID=1520 RepID=UPI0022280345|nr:helicase-related protein [Clostridium beijerinckii]UYZ38988.1 helicase-related protein [Clostridium beijerinckii]